MKKEDIKETKNQEVEETVEIVEEPVIIDIKTAQEANKTTEEAPKASTAEKVIDFAKSKSKKEKHSGELKKAHDEIAELKSTVQRTQADFLNYKRRSEKEKEDLTAFANEKILTEILGIVDNFERAISSFEDKESSMFSGVAMIHKQMADLLGKYSVEEIDTTGKFDPHLHHAVMQDQGDEPDMILEVFQKGYKIKEKVIRPSMVKVSM